MYAFEQDLSQHILIGVDEFVGVNLAPKPELDIIEQAGKWSAGRIMKCELQPKPM